MTFRIIVCLEDNYETCIMIPPPLDPCLDPMESVCKFEKPSGKSGPRSLSTTVRLLFIF